MRKMTLVKIITLWILAVRSEILDIKRKFWFTLDYAYMCYSFAIFTLLYLINYLFLIFYSIFIIKPYLTDLLTLLFVVSFGLTIVGRPLYAHRSKFPTRFHNKSRISHLMKRRVGSCKYVLFKFIMLKLIILCISVSFLYSLMQKQSLNLKLQRRG